MHFHFKTINEFEDKFNNYYPLDRCDCGGLREMDISTADFLIGDKRIVIEGCPILICKKCKNELIGNRIIKGVYNTYYKFEDHPGVKECKINIRSDVRFDYAKKAEFVYDSRDLNIPGCDIDLDPTRKDGFSLPVYFDRKVLNNFYLDDDYEMDFFSESYGDIGKKGIDGWQIPFGINENDKVVMFLGDLDLIDDDRSILMLKTYNITSDHKLVDTELYQAQMNCIFSDPILEERVILLREGFYKRIYKQFGVDLSHLEKEVKKKRECVKKPVVYSEREISGNVIALDGIFNEGISQDGLRELCKQLNVVGDVKSLKTRKLLQAIIATKEGEEKAKSIIAPLFRLNDLRVCFAHLLPEEDIQKLKDSIVKAYRLCGFNEYRKLYDCLIYELYELYKYLNITDFKDKC
jgi:hypothetical protein